MRTTLTLDDDVADFLKAQGKALGIPFKQIVNQYLRNGMAASHGQAKPSEPFEVVPHEGGFLPGVDALKLNQLVDDLEAQDVAEDMAEDLVRKGI